MSSLRRCSLEEASGLPYMIGMGRRESARDTGSSFSEIVLGWQELPGVAVAHAPLGPFLELEERTGMLSPQDLWASLRTLLSR